MKLKCIVIFMIIKNICSFNHVSPTGEKRQIQSSKKLEQVTGSQRRHRFSMPLSFSEIKETPPIDCFPEIEYPTSVLESEPFFFKSNDVLEPFQEDVKLSFKALAMENRKLKSTPVTITPTVKQNIVNTIEEKPTATTTTSSSTTSNNTLLKDISSEKLDFEFDNKEPSVKFNETTIEEKPITTTTTSSSTTTVTTSNNTLLKDISSEKLDFEFDNKEPSVKFNETTIGEKPITTTTTLSTTTTVTTSNNTLLKDISSEKLDYEFDNKEPSMKFNETTIEEKPIATTTTSSTTTTVTTSNNTLLKDISSEKLDFEFDNTEPSVKLNETTIEEKPTVETIFNETVINDVNGEHIEYDFDEEKENINSSTLNIQEEKPTTGFTSNETAIKETSNEEIKIEFDDGRENFKQMIVNNDEEKQTTTTISNHTAIKDKSNMDYDFDDEISALAEFTSIEQPAYTHDVNSQMVSDDMYPEMSDENSFYPEDDSQEQTITENNNMSDISKSSTSNDTQILDNHENHVLLLSGNEE